MLPVGSGFFVVVENQSTKDKTVLFVAEPNYFLFNFSEHTGAML